MLHLDLKKAQELVAECVAERGEDHRYEQEGESCLYVHGIVSMWDEEGMWCEDDFSDATPGCLIGMALNKGGIPLEVLGAGPDNSQDAFSLISRLEAGGYMTAAIDAIRFMRNVQGNQDRGNAWGDSVRAAMEGETLH